MLAPLLSCILCKFFSLSGEMPPVGEKPKGSKFLPPIGIENPIGTLYFLHGYGGHGFGHKHPIQDFRKAGYNVVVFNLPGHGSITGKLTYIVRNYKELVNYTIYVFKHYNERCGKNLPVAFVGFSTGAVITLLAVSELRKDPDVKKWIRCLIGIGAAFHVSHNAKWHIRVLAPIIRCILCLPWIGKYFAKHNLPRHFSPSEISADKIVQNYLIFNNRVSKDTLPLGWAASISRAGELALKILGSIDIPVLLLHGSEDRIAQCPTIDSEKHQNVRLVIRPGKHDPLSGPDPASITDEHLRFLPGYAANENDAVSRKIAIEFLNENMKI